MKKMVEIFSGSATIARQFKKQGRWTLTIDNTYPADLMADVLTLELYDIEQRLDGEPDFIWMSPPCEGFSVAAIGKNWRKVEDRFIPISNTAQRGLKLLRICREIIAWFPKAYFCIENPRGIMRMMREVRDLPRATISLCQYGEYRQKPTDIFNNIFEQWEPRDMCHPGDKCHERSPRGSRTGTQGIKTAYLRARLPEALAVEIELAVSRLVK